MKQLVLTLALTLTAGLAPQIVAQGPAKETTDTVARPKPRPGDKTAAPEAEKQQEKVESKFRKKPGEVAEGGPSFRTDATTVTVEVSVMDNKGNFIPGIPRDRFRVLEDGVPQNMATFGVGEGVMTVAMVIEFSNLYQQYWSESWYQTLTASYGFLETLKPEDYVAVVAYDLRPEILSDFSTDKRKAQEAMQRLRIAAFSESNLFDALTDTAERMSEIEGRKAIVLIASGVDTFSKLTFDKTRKIIQNAGVPIYSIGLMQALREYYDARGAMGPIQRLDFLQADNQMRTFSKESGGMSFFPRFYGEFPSIFQAITNSMRSQYTITYTSNNQTRDGKFRAIRVELVNPATNEPLKITDQKNKPLKYTIMAKKGYTAPREVE
ncbi:MAG: VWA domain-containing protein [Bryobacteraceae bacterium]|nr:VWA domain-containing protein [Bryobacteraceae bacterium]